MSKRRPLPATYPSWFDHPPGDLEASAVETGPQPTDPPVEAPSVEARPEPTDPPVEVSKLTEIVLKDFRPTTRDDMLMYLEMFRKHLGAASIESALEFLIDPINGDVNSIASKYKDILQTDDSLNPSIVYRRFKAVRVAIHKLREAGETLQHIDVTVPYHKNRTNPRTFRRDEIDKTINHTYADLVGNPSYLTARNLAMILLIHDRAVTPLELINLVYPDDLNLSRAHVRLPIKQSKGPPPD